MPHIKKCTTKNAELLKRTRSKKTCISMCIVMCILRGVCPKGWHVPTIGDMKRLFNFVGNEAGRLLSRESPNATDDYGFSLLTSGRIESPQKPL